ncbi:MAG: hypothetical protein Q7S14_01245 [bacterium]|nr:hypothetical protein [bacterium]
MKIFPLNSTAHLSALAELLINISAGYFGLILLTAIGNFGIMEILKNIILGLGAYLMSVKIREVIL